MQEDQEKFERIGAAVQSVVSLPGSRAALLARICLQYLGRISKAKRKMFIELTDKQVMQVQGVVTTVLLTPCAS